MKLSVIIPAFNVGQYLARTIDSLKSQLKPDFEVIIVDDGSTDNTLLLAESTIENTIMPEFRIITKSNGGVSSARNAGLAAASGDYVLFLDGDDFVAPSLTQVLYEKIGNKQIDIVCWGYDILNESGSIKEFYFEKYGCPSGMMSGVEALRRIVVERRLQIWTGSALYRRKFLTDRELTFMEGCGSGEDQELIFKAVAAAESILFIDEVLSFYFKRRGSLTNRFEIERFESILALLRVVEYYRNIEGNEMEAIISAFRRKNLVANYFYNIESCLENSEGSSIVQLLREIDRVFPGMNEQMRRVMKDTKGEYSYNPLKIRIFLISPAIYKLLFDLKYGIRNKLRAVVNVSGSLK